jgi:hypothetical protein
MKDSCSSVSKLLEKYFDLEVMGEERFLVEGHLRNCLACRNALRSMEELRTLIKVPVEEAVRKEEFPWLWQRIEREIHSRQEKLTWWQFIRSRLDVSSSFKRKVWIPAAATVAILLFITAQIIFQKPRFYSDGSIVEFVESQTHNVMVYQLEKQKVTVIWLFEGSEKD